MAASVIESLWAKMGGGLQERFGEPHSQLITCSPGADFGFIDSSIYTVQITYIDVNLSEGVMDL